jgi:lysozyme family protein
MMDCKFEKIVENVLKNEGGYSDDQDDLGGETKYGISKRTYPLLTVKDLTVGTAKDIYYQDFWINQAYKHFVSSRIAEKIFDLAINIGKDKAHVILQRALKAVGKIVEEDGRIGKKTLEAVNSSNERELLAATKSEAAGYYRCVVISKPTQKKFLAGWLKRAYS